MEFILFLAIVIGGVFLAKNYLLGKVASAGSEKLLEHGKAFVAKTARNIEESRSIAATKRELQSRLTELEGGAWTRYLEYNSLTSAAKADFNIRVVQDPKLLEFEAKVYDVAADGSVVLELEFDVKNEFTRDYSLRPSQYFIMAKFGSGQFSSYPKERVVPVSGVPIYAECHFDAEKRHFQIDLLGCQFDEVMVDGLGIMMRQFTKEEVLERYTKTYEGKKIVLPGYKEYLNSI